MHLRTSLNVTVLLHGTLVVCECPEIILDVALVADVKIQFPGLHAHLTSVVSSFLSRYKGTTVYANTIDTTEELWLRIQ